MTPVTRCVMPGCYRTTHGTHCCHIHELAPTATVDAEYEAARLDPTTDRDRWDVWGGGGLEAPGGDEW